MSGLRPVHDAKINELSQLDPGYLLTKQVSDAGISYPYMSDYLARHPEYERMERGIYVNTRITEPDKYYILSIKKKVIFSHMTSLYLHDLISFEPDICELTVSMAYHNVHLEGSKLFESGDHLKIYRLYPGELKKWMGEVQTPFGHTVFAYDVEKCICDIIKERAMYDTLRYKEAIRNYFEQTSKLEVSKLMTAAREIGVYDTVMEYMTLLR